MTPVISPTQQPDKLVLGSQEADLAYMGSVKVWESSPVGSTPGLTVWLDASQLALADGAAVNSWPDLSGKGNHGNIVGTPAPTVRANALNGKRVVRFAASEGRVRGNNGIVPGGDNLGLYKGTILYVTHMWGGNNGRVYTAVYPPVNYLVGFHTSAYECMYDGGWNTNGIGYPPAPTPWKIYGSDANHDGTNYTSRFYINGVWTGSNYGSAGLGQTYALSGYDAAATQETCDCEVAELIIYNRRLTDVERQKIEGYLKKKWALP